MICCRDAAMPVDYAPKGAAGRDDVVWKSQASQRNLSRDNSLSLKLPARVCTQVFVKFATDVINVLAVMRH